MKVFVLVVEWGDYILEKSNISANIAIAPSREELYDKYSDCLEDQDYINSDMLGEARRTMSEMLVDGDLRIYEVEL